MTKTLRSEIGINEWGYSKVLKLRVMERTYNELVAMQEKRKTSMAQLLRELIYESMNKEITEK
jgi:predicted HicB family RNase H-like nuclease